jgi:uncharacterized membrane protein YGL010W
MVAQGWDINPIGLGYLEDRLPALGNDLFTVNGKLY